ncbi:hypothetical protein F4678DRAFT_406196 [Xylaria arbuscula]|nr:hypothetical protein F4678DRAFT_406196 [Xylaria arbuscula]
MWELIMAAVSLIAFGALVVVLAVEDGKPDRRWGPLTLNSVNSLLTTVIGSSLAAVIGAALSQQLWNGFGQQRTGSGLTTRPARELQLYSDASRGPMGSLTLLWKQGPLSIAALGAIVTILNLAFATFTQNLIAPETLKMKDPTLLAQPFARSQRYVANSENGIGGTQKSVDISTLATIIAAGLQGNNAQPLKAQCPSGSCTYPTGIPSLAVVGSCTDVTSHLDHKGTCTYTTPPCNITTDDGDYDDFLCGPSGDPCTYSLPTGPFLKFQPGYDTGKEADLYSIWNATDLASSPPHYPPEIPSFAYNDTSRMYLMKFAAIGLPFSAAGAYVTSVNKTIDQGTLPPMQAHECAMWLALNYYDIDVQNGTTVSTVTKTYTSIMSNNVQPGLNFVDDVGLAIGEAPYYGIGSSDDVYAIKAITGDFFPPGNSYVSIYSNTTSPYRYGTPGDFAFNLIEGLYRNSDNLQNWTLNMAQALTNNFGTILPATQTDQYDGVAYSEQLYFNIRWYWISLPVVVLILSYTFLAMTIEQTRRIAVQPWKGDVLVMAFADVDTDVKTTIATSGALDCPRGLDKAVGDVRVGLGSNFSEGIVFSSSSDTL